MLFWTSAHWLSWMNRAGGARGGWAGRGQPCPEPCQGLGWAHLELPRAAQGRQGAKRVRTDGQSWGVSTAVPSQHSQGTATGLEGPSALLQLLLSQEHSGDRDTVRAGEQPGQAADPPGTAAGNGSRAGLEQAPLSATSVTKQTQMMEFGPWFSTEQPEQR